MMRVVSFLLIESPSFRVSLQVERSQVKFDITLLPVIINKYRLKKKFIYSNAHGTFSFRDQWSASISIV